MNIKIEGTVVQTKFYSEKWSSVVLRETISPINQFTAVGMMPKVVSGQELSLNGEWTIHEVYGQQFQVSSVDNWEKARVSHDIASDDPAEPTHHLSSTDSSRSSKAPEVHDLAKDLGTDKAQTILTLSSSFITGIGIAKAETIWKAFGKNVFTVIEKEPNKLCGVSGIKSATASSIRKSYIANKRIIPIRMALDNTVTDHQVTIIYQTFQDKALDVLKKDPYQLIERVDGFGFKTADKIARGYGVALDAQCRIMGAILYILAEDTSSGHCYAFPPAIEDALTRLLGPLEDLNSKAADAVKALRADGRVVVEPGDGAIWARSLYQAEVETANRIKELLHPERMLREVYDYEVENALLNVKDSTLFELEEYQRKAVVSVFRNPFSLVTGGPGTGKTTIIKAILHVWAKLDSLDRVALMAPTGKATRRITELTGHQAYTIHQQTGKTAKTATKTFAPSEDIGLVIVDEGSMIDILLALRLLNYIKNGTRVVILGDKDQLPSIGPGNFFWELYRASAVIPKVELKLSFRQHGAIATNAYRMNNGSGVHSFVQDESFRFIKAARDETQAFALAEYGALVSEYGVENVCLLTPMRQRGSTCSNELNRIIQEKVNPPSPFKPEYKVFDTLIRVGDRVGCNRNLWDKDIANGDVGTVMEISKSPLSKWAGVRILFDSGVDVVLSDLDLRVISLAYAQTIHKSQGSEYLGTVVVFAGEHWFMRQRNLLYTAVTRARQKLRLVGDARAIAACIEKNDAPHRNTKLKERLCS